MKLAKKLQKEIKALMDDYWGSYMKGNLKHWAGYLPDDYRNIGGTKEEIWNTKKEIVNYSKGIMDQMVGMADIRNKTIQIIPYDPYFMVHEFMDMFIKVEGKFTFYGKFRLSSLIQKTAKGWKVLHQHGSYPDSKTEEGEAFAFDEIKAENVKLKDAVQRRTIELEEKNRELEIETALEKVRAIALSMKEPADMPEVCKTISLQLQSLGVKEIRNVQTAIFYESRGTYMNYEYYARHRKTIITETKYTDHKIAKAFAAKMLKGKGEFYITHIKGKKVKEWLAYQKTTNVFIDRFLEKASSLNYYWHSLGPVALGISTYMPLNRDDLNLFHRFLKVFELAYTRYLDIEQAMAQAKEAQIEAVLERVRSVAMGMMKSDDLLKICEAVFIQLKALDFTDTDLRNVQIVINNDEKGMYSGYQYADYIGGEIAEVPYNLHPVVKKLSDKLRKSNDAFADITITGKELKDWKQFVNKFPQKHDKKLNKAAELHYYFYSVGIGALGISSFYSLSEEKLSILQRLRNVFNLSYQRYSDIALAEEQAKEARIELGLERVRARAMAMQHSDELAELVATVFKELNQLDFSLASCIIWIHGASDKSNALWIASDKMNKPARPLQIRPFYPDFFTSIIAAWKVKDPKWIFSLTGTEKKKFEKLFFKEYPELPEAFKKPVSENKQIVFSASFNNFGALEIVATEPLTDEKFDILHRFGKVFDTSYTRFNDLQKAEAQAREAKIEAALERVRSRTMAMQKSEELSETSFVLFEQFKALGETSDQISIGIFNKEQNVMELYSTLYGTQWKEAARVDLEEPVVMKKIYAAWKDQKKTLLIDITGADLRKYNEYRKKLSGLDYKERRWVIHIAFFSKGMLSFSAPEPHETIQLLERFAGVFDGTYTRFLDLQKAEAQAREAQIETALERVRSRSMGMQKSEELKEVIQVVYQQFVHLNINIEHTGFVVDYKLKADWHFWIADKNEIPSKITHPYFESVWASQFNEAKEKGTDLFTTHLNFAEKNKFYQELLSYVPGLPEESKQFYLNCPGLAASTTLQENVSLYIENFSGTPYTDEENKILMRFGKVFQQTYTRFLDLQKAEAQAREAKIEAALERTRTQSMIMQHSKELDDTLRVFHEQVLLLGIKSEFSYLWLPDEDKGRHIFWAAWGEEIQGSFIFKSKALNYPLDRNEPATAKCLVDWKSDEPVHSYYLLPGEEVENYFASWKELLEETERLKPKNFPGGLYYVEAFMKYGCFGVMIENELSKDEKKILYRFSIEFERTYTRFLDLQKAEAQAREAQIEAALERVRSRTMAMQRSEELAETSAVLFKQLITLGIEPNRLYIGIIRDESGEVEAWATDEDGTKVQKQFTLNSSKNESVRKMYEGWKEQKKSISIDMQGAELEKYLHYLHDELNVPFKQGLQQKRRVQNVAYFSKGFIGIASPDEQPEETTFLLERFAAVFNLTYTRFNDLQIAEAHALKAEEDLIKLQTEKKRAEDALTELKSTQTQLIQSEKMASLGELTAGIAHEIQNPLNFVNNFSEVSNELIDEMNTELDKGNVNEAKAIAADVKQNLEKINHHGKRADGIVKGMLQHSRSSSGVKEPTDINALCDEYLRLSYHGLRAKDKSFNATIKTDFDESLPKINVIPQDIGRVVLNLLTNAFYVVDEKKKAGLENYEPTVTIATRYIQPPLGGQSVEIKVSDNGGGIPQKVMDKIFQPFFTTKPAGQGTGLGLSLSYDIITKGHGGTLEVKTEENMGSEFTITVPI